MELAPTAQGTVKEEPAPVLAPSAPVAAPPPPPPPPAPAEAEQYAGDAEQEIVLTGSRVRQANRKTAAERATAAQSVDAYGEFLSRLRVAARSGDRPSLIRLVGFPLSVHRDGRVETYRSRSEVEREFDRIFTPRVKAEILGGQSLQDRNGSRLRGSPRIWFGPSCSDAACDEQGPIRIREVTP